MPVRIVLKLIKDFGTQTITFCGDPGLVHEYLDQSQDVYEFHMLYGQKYGKHQYVNIYLVRDTCPLTVAMKIRRYIRDQQ